MNGLRYKQGSDFASRMKAGSEDLADLRQHRGYAYLMDMLDAELRSIWRQWTDQAIPDDKATGLRTRAIWLADLIRSIDQKVSEKDWMDEQERIFSAMHTDEALLAEATQALNGGQPNQGIY